MQRPALPLLALALLVAGCVSAPQALTIDPGAAPGPSASNGFLQAHDAAGAMAVPSVWNSLQVRLAPTGFPTGEPTLGVAKDGTIFTFDFEGSLTDMVPGYLARSRDHGATWERVGDPILSPRNTFDPWIWLDPATDRIYNTHLQIACTWLAWSDDLGATWQANPLGGCGLPAHDHQKVTGGPPPAGTPTLGYPSVLYYAYNSFLVTGTPVRLGTVVTTSLDGGRTWTPGSVAHASDCHVGVTGPIAVAPDGTAYMAKASCRSLDLVMSRDAGLTWSLARSFDEHGIQPALATDPDIAVDADGTAYVVWPGEDGLLYLSVGSGTTWSDPVRVTPPDVTASVYSVVAAGEPGKVAVAYLGTTSDTSKWKSKDPSDATEDAVWHAYMTFSEDAKATDPVFVTKRLTPDDDPVQVGCIWLRGGSSDCRNLFDFIDLVERDGRAYLVYTDGCQKCRKAADSHRGDAVVAIVEAGPGLRDAALQPFA